MDPAPSAQPAAAAAAGPARGVGDRTITGAAWMFGRTMLARVISLVEMAILARQLTPEMFGLAALAQALLLWMTASGESGITAYRNGVERMLSQSSGPPSHDSSNGANARLASTMSDDVRKLSSWA